MESADLDFYDIKREAEEAASTFRQQVFSPVNMALNDRQSAQTLAKRLAAASLKLTVAE